MPNPKKSKKEVKDPATKEVQQEENQHHSKYILIAGLIAFVLAGGILILIAVLIFFGVRNLELKDDSEGVQQTQISTSSPTSAQPPATVQIEQDRVEVDEFLLAPFDPTTVSLDNPAFQKFELPESKEYTMTVEYRHIGDEPMNKAFVRIALDEGLQVLPGSIMDSFNGLEAQAVPDSQYDQAINTISFGPGDQDSETSVVQPNQQGNVRFKVVRTDDAKPGEKLRLYSFMSDQDQQRIGKITLVYFEIV